MTDRRINILLDNQAFLQKFGGISKIFAELVRLIYTKNDKQFKIQLPIFFTENENLHEHNLSPNFYLDFLRKLNFKGKGTIINAINAYNKALVIKALKKNNYDIYLATYFNPYFLEYLHKPFILTIYDMIHELYPEMFPNDSIISYKKELIFKAARIVAISMSTKNDILSIYPEINPGKIDVIYLSDSIKVSPLELNLPRKYILFVGKRSLYKNFFFLLEAFGKSVAKDENIILLCLGGGEFSMIEKIQIDSMGLSENVIYRSIVANETYQFYNKALFFVFPTLYEGFGIPILEAMRSGCPCLLSSSSSLTEVGNNAAVYFNPENLNELTSKMNDLIENKAKRDILKKLGIARAKSFSWEITHSGYLNSIKKALDVK